MSLKDLNRSADRAEIYSPNSYLCENGHVRQRGPGAVTGVTLERRRRQGQDTLYWVAEWPNSKQGNTKRRYSVKRYGYEEARGMAIETRRNALAENIVPRRGKSFNIEVAMDKNVLSRLDRVTTLLGMSRTKFINDILAAALESVPKTSGVEPNVRY